MSIQECGHTTVSTLQHKRRLCISVWRGLLGPDDRSSVNGKDAGSSWSDCCSGWCKAQYGNGSGMFAAVKHGFVRQASPKRLSREEEELIRCTGTIQRREGTSTNTLPVARSDVGLAARFRRFTRHHRDSKSSETQFRHSHWCVWLLWPKVWHA